MTAERGPGFGVDALERRRVPRIPVETLAVPVSVVGARLVNLSLLGMMIESPVPLEREAIMKFRLSIGGYKGDAEARVAASTVRGRGPVRRFGIGLEFAALSTEMRDHLRRALGPLAETAAPSRTTTSVSSAAGGSGR
jgi:PilZ domain